MNENRLTGSYPVIGIRPIIGARRGPLKVRESLEEQTVGVALLAAYMLYRKDGESLPDYLDTRAFSNAESTTLMADRSDIAGFNAFLDRYQKAFPIEKTATEVL